VRDGHLGETAHEKQGDDGSDRVADEHGGSGETDGEAAAEEEAGSDGPADGDHRKLGRSQAAMETLLTVFNCFGGFVVSLRHQNLLKVAQGQIDSRVECDGGSVCPRDA
jgi:hypothetical protein